jgi:hypothetical protein
MLFPYAFEWFDMFARANVATPACAPVIFNMRIFKDAKQKFIVVS